MKTITLKLAATLIIPTALLVLTGCKTAPLNPLATQASPAMAGGLATVNQTFEVEGTVTDVVQGQRKLAIRPSGGSTITCKVAPQVANFGQIQVGSHVKADLTDEVAFFLVQNGPPPSAGAGVTVTGSAGAGQTGSVVLQTTDARAKVFNVDRSYRLLRVQFADGSRIEYKVDLPNTLLGVQKGDEVVVRTTEPLAISLETK